MLGVFSAGKLTMGLQALVQAPSIWTGGLCGAWGVCAAIQFRYLKMAYLYQVYMVERIELNREKDAVRIHTMLHSQSFNLFALARTRLSMDKAIATVYEVPISEVKFAEKNSEDAQVFRILVGPDELKFFLHKTRTLVRDDELLHAVLSPQVRRVESLS
uniref:Uncharacterized protein n=1 Tax=Strombidium rassoulzadegani TaxID=1082188 RepID=A0A7S3FWX1_9SPIT|mmetsp:Transcript_9326/g.15725  ORF Transcript_9326/g.15725 Transcript_9326/m.15725 type:complete len:159 (+) Transcript_9326:402-878(+)